MSDSTRTRTSLIEESTPGTTPAGNFLVIPKANFTLQDRLRYVESEIIREDANVQGVHLVGKGYGGGLNTEFVHTPATEALGLLLQAGMRSTVTAAAAQVTGVTAISGVLTATGIGTGVEVGDFGQVLTSGDVPVGKGYWEVTGVGGANTITCAGVPDGSNYKFLRGERIKNGTTDKNVSVEHARLDTNLFRLFRGVGVGRMGFAIADEQITKWSFGLDALSSVRATSPYASTGIYTAASNKPSYTAVKATTFELDGTAYELNSLAIDIDNSLRARRKVGSDSPTKLSRGTFRVTGNVEIYLDAWTELTKASAGTASKLNIPLVDADGNVTVFSLPQTKWVDVTENTDRKDTDEMARFRFQAELDPTESISMRMLRWVA